MSGGINYYNNYYKSYYGSKKEIVANFCPGYNPETHECHLRKLKDKGRGVLDTTCSLAIGKIFKEGQGSALREEDALRHKKRSMFSLE